MNWSVLTLFLLITARMTGFVLFNPLFGRRGIPGMVKAGLILMLSLTVYSAAPGQQVQMPSTLLGLALFAAAAAWMLQGVRQAARVSDEEGLRMAEQAVRQAAVSCYALEGAYPASYADLKQRSGVAVDEERYIIFYEIFASNIMPDVTVLERQVAP